MLLMALVKNNAHKNGGQRLTKSSLKVLCSDVQYSDRNQQGIESIKIT